ncbi:M20 family metallopeptidase [Fonticella tunisiensis]|uniref:Putative dipeptidase n=1 Tax=Fonticella tunisiensis TaxID=1096341 RepID=A0A4R7KUT5_9CLOT|nr:M20 family metallopeptidase [Fonticella tunisiensis]TDT63261.1 putative dipeptidase [Fonticella tunisiensis]
MLTDGTIKKELEALKSDLIHSIKELVSIPSIIDQNSTKYPFGENIDKALRKTLEICKGLGFRTYYDPEGYYGYAEVGQGDELIGILGHLDVVPPGSLDVWKHDPFDPVIEDGRLYGRGTQDDKGPILACVYAAKALMNLGVTFNKRLRFIFGTDEESLWRDMKKYMEKEEKPTAGFTPDSTFPLIYAEKGLLQIVLEGENETNLLLEGGNAFNSVPDNIVYTGDKQEELKAKLIELGYEYEYELKEKGVKVLGKSAHAQVAEKGINAINRLAIALKSIGITSKAIEFIVGEIQEDPFATKIFGTCEDEDSGKLKFNIGKISLKEKETLSIDIRIPVTIEKDEIVNKISRAANKYGLAYREYDWLKPIYIPKDHFLVRTLLGVYREVTKDMVSEPISSGGATYARAIDNCVAFGAVLPGRTKTEHQPNEHIVLEDMFIALEIYAKAIYKLTCCDSSGAKGR